MDVLIIFAVTCLHARSRSGGHPQGEARFPSIVKLHQFPWCVNRRWLCRGAKGRKGVAREWSYMPKSTPAYACMQTNYFGYVEVILKVNARFVTEGLLRRSGIELSISTPRGEVGWYKIVVDVIYTKIDYDSTICVKAPISAPGDEFDSSIKNKYVSADAEFICSSKNGSIK